VFVKNWVRRGFGMAVLAGGLIGQLMQKLDAGAWKGHCVGVNRDPFVGVTQG
jgi:hypothetical protein